MSCEDKTPNSKTIHGEPGLRTIRPSRSSHYMSPGVQPLCQLRLGGGGASVVIVAIAQCGGPPLANHSSG